MKEYEHQDLFVIWKPELCEHAKVCWQTLPLVYRPKERPWIRPEFATKEELIDQINKCPSKALSYRLKEDSQ